MENSAAEMPRLSGSQRAYLFRREAFLDGIQQRADALFARGYDVKETPVPHVFLVLCPESQGLRTAYRVNPVQATCTCPFFAHQGAGQPLADTLIPCKHLVGLPRLLHVSCAEAIRQRRLGRFYRLWHHWQGALKADPSLTEAWKALGPLHSKKGSKS